MNHPHAGLLLALLLAAAGSAVAQSNDLDAIHRLAADDWQAAVQKLDERIAADADDVQARFLKGLILLDHGQTGRARAVFAEITLLFPRLPEAFNNLAVIYAGEGEYERARQALLSAAANAPDYAAVRANLGDLYAKMALDAYRKALELNPEDAASAAKLELMEQLFSPGG